MRSQRCNLEQRADHPIPFLILSCQDPSSATSLHQFPAQPTTWWSIKCTTSRWWPGYFGCKMMTKMISEKFSWNEWANRKSGNWVISSKEWLSGCPPLVVTRIMIKNTHITRWSGTGGWNVVVVMMELRIHMTNMAISGSRSDLTKRSWSMPDVWSDTFEILIRPDAVRKSQSLQVKSCLWPMKWRPSCSLQLSQPPISPISV